MHNTQTQMLPWHLSGRNVNKGENSRGGKGCMRACVLGQPQHTRMRMRERCCYLIWNAGCEIFSKIISLRNQPIISTFQSQPKKKIGSFITTPTYTTLHAHTIHTKRSSNATWLIRWKRLRNRVDTKNSRIVTGNIWKFHGNWSGIW